MRNDFYDDQNLLIVSVDLKISDILNNLTDRHLAGTQFLSIDEKIELNRKLSVIKRRIDYAMHKIEMFSETK